MANGAVSRKSMTWLSFLRISWTSITPPLKSKETTGTYCFGFSHKTRIAFDFSCCCESFVELSGGTRTRRCQRYGGERCPGRERRLWQHLRLILACPAHQSPETCSAPHPLLLRLDYKPVKQENHLTFSNTVNHNASKIIILFRRLTLHEIV